MEYKFYSVSLEYYDGDLNDFKPVDGFMIAKSYTEVVEYITEKYFDDIRNITVEETVWDCGPFVMLPEWYNVDTFKRAVKEANEY